MASPRSALGFVLFEAILFALASLTHGGKLFHGYEHTRAAIAEAVIAAVLALGFLIALASPAMASRTAMLVQAFGALGVLVGLVMIAIGLGPRTLLDLVLHAVMLVLLVTGFVAALRSR
jgi:hypothetical protein